MGYNKRPNFKHIHKKGFIRLLINDKYITQRSYHDKRDRSEVISYWLKLYPPKKDRKIEIVIIPDWDNWNGVIEPQPTFKKIRKRPKL